MMVDHDLALAHEELIQQNSREQKPHIDVKGLSLIATG